MPDSRELAVEILGAEPAHTLFEEGAATPLARIIEETLAGGISIEPAAVRD